jgi:hypothetical protein
MIFKVSKNDFFEDNPSAKAVEAFVACSSREMKYICLVYDYESPYRKLSISERKLKAVFEADFRIEKEGKRPDKYAREMMNGKVSKVQTAIKAFMALQPDKEKELAKAIDTQLDEIQRFLLRPKETEGEWKIAVSLLEKMPKILRDRKEVMDILQIRDELNNETGIEESSEPLSELEQMNGEED